MQTILVLLIIILLLGGSGAYYVGPHFGPQGGLTILFVALLAAVIVILVNRNRL